MTWLSDIFIYLTVAERMELDSKEEMKDHFDTKML